MRGKLTLAIPAKRHPGKWTALYHHKIWEVARNALGRPILCDSRELAHCVARARIERISWSPR